VIWAWISLLAMVALIACEQAFRRYVTPRIVDIFENVPPFNVVIEKPHPNDELLEIPVADGVTLQGSLLNADRKDAKGLVLFLPELRGNHWMARRYCDALIRDGYLVMAVDFRSQGESDLMPGYVPIHWITEYEMADVDAMLGFIESRPVLNTLPMIVFGVSRGGVAALVAACRYPRIRGVIADSAFGTMSMTKYFVDRFVSYVIPQWVYRFLPAWHVDQTLRNAIQESEKRRSCKYVHLEREQETLESSSVLLISGGCDSYVTPEIAARLQSIIGKHCQLWIAPGAKHNMSRSVCTEEYDRRILNHCNTCLGIKPDQVSVTCTPGLTDAALLHH
jgi:pimeloyl-ACP methyl ester carboxylesterase